AASATHAAQAVPGASADGDADSRVSRRLAWCAGHRRRSQTRETGPRRASGAARARAPGVLACFDARQSAEIAVSRCLGFCAAQATPTAILASLLQRGMRATSVPLI